MKLLKRLPLFLLFILAALALAGCGTVKGTLVMGDTYRLASGETLNDDLTVMGGVAELEAGSTVNGDVAVMGGTLRVDGTINGDISVMGGSVSLSDSARVSGDVTQLGGSVSKAPGAVVSGTFGKKGSTINLPRFSPMMGMRNLDPILSPFVAFFQALAMAALAVLVYLFAARPMERVGQAVLQQPAISGGIGLLTVIVVPPLLIVLGITIILLPVTLLGIVVAGVAWVFGWLSLGLIAGRQIARMFNQNWTDPLSAGVGTLTLSLVASLLNIIPCIGWMAGFIAGVIGLGAVVLTRFGTQDYTGAGPAPYRTSGGPAPRPTPPPVYTPAPPSPYSAPVQQPMRPEPPAPPAPASPAADFFGTEGPTHATFVPDADISGEERPAAPRTEDDRREEPTDPAI